MTLANLAMHPRKILSFISR